LIRDGLQELGITNIMHANDGEQALKMMMATPAHMISDFNMPKLNGLQLLQAIRTYKPIRKTPFIILTGGTTKQIVEIGAKLDLNNYLTKPFNPPGLKKAVEGVVGPLN
jgi:two-component system, chemotaxis family, chemotaxis protein CheY